MTSARDDGAWKLRASAAAIVVALTATLVHGCTYVACAGLAGGVMVATICVPMLGGATTLVAAITTWRHHVDRTARSRAVALVANATSALSAISFGGLLLHARQSLVERAPEFPAELAAFDDLATSLGLGAACWLLAAIVMLAIALRVPTTR